MFVKLSKDLIYDALAKQSNDKHLNIRKKNKIILTLLV